MRVRVQAVVAADALASTERLVDVVHGEHDA
jgi:hypothetical protein